MDKDIKSFIDMTEKKRAKVSDLTKALKATQFENVSLSTKLPDGSTQNVFVNLDKTGKAIYTACKDDKNIMTFSNKKQLLDYLE